MQKRLRIAYIGDSRANSNSLLRAEALRRLGCIVEVIDIYKFLRKKPKFRRWVEYRTGYRFLSKHILEQIKYLFQDPPTPYNLIWVNGGELLGPSAIKWLKETYKCPIILYQNDDPTGSREYSCFGSLRASLPLYDLCVLVRPETALEVLSSCAKKSLRVFMSYDDKISALDNQSSETLFCQTVTFVGALIPGERRDHFLLRLIKEGIPVRIVGNGWKRSRLWPILKDFFLGPAVSGKDYSHILCSTSACLGLLSHQNRDLHTRRSVEIPAYGGLFCAERTSEHQLFYEEGVEALFWDTAEECTKKCKTVLVDPQLNYRVKSAGSQRVREMGVGNEDICRQVLNSILSK